MANSIKTVGGTSPLHWDPFGVKKRRDERNAINKAKGLVSDEINKFAKLDTSNIYAGVSAKDLGATNLENVYEDATIDQRAAQFQQQQFQQSQANILDAMQGGGSFNAGNIQALANQAAMSAQQSAANIGQQEQANKRAQMQEAARIQDVERAGIQQAFGMRMSGAEQSRNLEWQKQQGILAARTGQAESLIAQQQARKDRNAQMWGAAIGAVGSIAGGALGSDRKLKKDVKKIGKSPSGLNIYSFKYKDDKYGKGTYQGVMSDEVPSYAVVPGENHDMVDYSKIDVNFKEI
tara:strand:- start:84 stop:959 length:876 start_codon:yes stop_codon:yes gene_type:complete